MKGSAVLQVKLEADAFSVSGMVRIGYVPAAIARANGARNAADAERKLWSYLNAAVLSGALKPLHEEHLATLPTTDFGAGVVPFRQLHEWGISVGLFEFVADERSACPLNSVATIRRSDVAPLITETKGTSDAPAVDAARPPSNRKKETQEQRQARRYQMCVDAGLKMPDSTYGALPRGIGRLAKAEGIKRQSFAEEVRAHISRLHGR